MVTEERLGAAESGRTEFEFKLATFRLGRRLIFSETQLCL